MPPEPAHAEGPGHHPQALDQTDQLGADHPQQRYHRPHDASDVTCDPFAAAVLRGDWAQLELEGGSG